MNSKKFLSCTIALMLSLGTLTVLPEQFNDKLNFSITAEAASRDFVIATDSDGFKYIDEYKGNGGDVVIPKDISYINNGAFEGKTSITSITAKGDLYAWKNAFKGCTKLRRVTVNGDAYIDQSAFAYCASLETFEIKGSIDEVIGGDAFIGCSSLKSFKVKGDEFDYVIGEEAFYDCISLRSFEITNGCTEINNDAFTNCIKLNSLTIPEKTKFNTRNGNKNVGYCEGYLNEDDEDPTYFLADGSKPVYLYYYSYEIPNYYWDTEDLYGLFLTYQKFVPQKLTLTVTKGSSAESFAKKNGIAYNYATASSDTLAAPDNIKASSTTPNSVTITWDKVSGADAYTVYMYNSTTGKYEKYKTVTSNSCVIKSLKKNTKYKFKIVALDKVNGKYKEGEKSDPVAVTTKKK